MAIKFLGVGDEINAIIRKHSEAALTENLPKIKARLFFIGETWQEKVQAKLGVYRPPPWDWTTPRNTNKWPKHRKEHGGLVDSILLPRIRFTTRTPKFKGRRGRASLEFIMDNFYGPIAKTGYGETLNSRRDFDIEGGSLGVKPFAGWKTRASRILFDLFAQRL